MRFHEDGARTKALLGKVRQPRAGARTPSSPAGAPLAPGPAARPAFIVAANDGRGASGKLFPAFALPPSLPPPTPPNPRIPRSHPCEIALSSRSRRNRGTSALGPSSTGCTKAPLILRLFGGSLMSPRGAGVASGQRKCVQMFPPLPNFRLPCLPWVSFFPSRQAVRNVYCAPNVLGSPASLLPEGGSCT